MHSRLLLTHCSIALVIALSMGGRAEDAVRSVAAPVEPSAGAAARRERPAFWQGDASLSEEQRKAVREVAQAIRRENREHFEKLRRSRRELEEAVFAPVPDESAIKARAAEVGRLEGEIAVARARHIARIRPQLSPEQLERLKSLRGELDLAERFRRPEVKAKAEPEAKPGPTGSGASDAGK